MKRYINFISLALVLLSVLGLASCQSESVYSEGEGRLSMKLNIAKSISDTPQKAPAENNDQMLADSCRVRLYSSKGLVRYFKGLNTVPSELWLKSGEYRIVAQTGDSVPATFTMGYYKGESPLTIETGKTTTVTITCGIKSSLVTVAFTDSLLSMLTDIQATISSADGELTFTTEHIDSIGYFNLPENETTLNWHITGKNYDGSLYEQTGVLENVKSAHRYDITFSYNDTEFNIGGAFFNIIVNDRLVEIAEDVTIHQRPAILGNEFDIDGILLFEVGNGEDISVWVNSSSAITALTVSSEQMTAMGFPANSINFMEESSINLTAWNNAGLSHRYEYDSEKDKAVAKITIAQSCIKALAEGTYLLDIHAVDANKKEWTETLNITISNAVVLTEEPIRADIWATKATLRAKLMRETSDALTFKYRVKGETWQTVPAQLADDVLTAQITGLTAGTTYEYCAVAGDMASAVTVEFTTESKFIFPNAGFEDFHTSNDVLLMYGKDSSMWWDTGNHGSSTLDVNVTTQDKSIKNSGNSSVKMKSQFVGFLGIGKFAAGNIFAGRYAGTDGTDGIIDMGRPFTTRPSQLKGYFKYQTGKVDYSSTDMLPEGSTDIGSIYIAIGDWDGPVTVKTKASERTLFDPNDPHIIAYGVLDQATNTEGDGLVPFTINLDYRATDRVPTYIILVASASKYGDYFTGSTSSAMWIDDLELVYE